MKYLAVIAMMAVAGCAQFEAAQRGFKSVLDAGPEVAAAEARIIATCTAPPAELGAAKAALAVAYEDVGLSDPVARADGLVLARCGADALPRG